MRKRLKKAFEENKDIFQTFLDGFGYGLLGGLVLSGDFVTGLQVGGIVGLVLAGKKFIDRPPKPQ